METILGTVLVGVGATAMIDLWAVFRERAFGIPRPDYALVGRWLAHMRSGRFRHERISAATVVPGERALGWTAHYLIGIAFAAVLVGVAGRAWLQQPASIPALLVGIGTSAAPFLLLQPGMGAGIAACRTPRPSAARIQTLVTHSVFGLGLYAAGWAFRFIHAT